MSSTSSVVPDNTAVRVALWRALHLEADPAPHVFVDPVGLELVAPEPGWQQRPDMSPFTRPFRASILARARFVEETVQEQLKLGVRQYVILGAGLDTFAQRHSDLLSTLTVFEIDQPASQTWKRQRLDALGYHSPVSLRWVPVDFERGESWLAQVESQGFDRHTPAVFASTGVSMYLTLDAIRSTLEQIASLASGTTLVMSFMLPLDQLDAQTRPGVEAAARGAKANGTPFISFFMPDEMTDLARSAGFRQVRHISADTLADRYFSGRTDGLRPPSNSEELLVAST